MEKNNYSSLTRLSFTQQAFKLILSPYLKPGLVPVFLFFSISILTQNLNAQVKATNQPQSKTSLTDTVTKSYCFLDITSPAHFPSGEYGFDRYISRTLVTPANTPSGEVVISFNVGLGGNVTDVCLLKSLTAAADQEVLAMFNHFLRFSPGIEHGVPVINKFTASISFTPNVSPRACIFLVKDH